MSERKCELSPWATAGSPCPVSVFVGVLNEEGQQVRREPGLRRPETGHSRGLPVDRSGPEPAGNLRLTAARPWVQTALRKATGGRGATWYKRSPGWSLGEPCQRRRQPEWHRAAANQQQCLEHWCGGLG